MDQLDVSKVETEGGHLIRNKEGEELFFLIFGKQYKEGGPQYLLVSLYLLFFLSLFYVYGRLLKNISCNLYVAANAVLCLLKRKNI